MDEVWVSTSKGKIFGMASGNPGAPLILGIHGWSQRNGWHTWLPMMDPLAAGGYRVISIDMPGWGKSEPWSDRALSEDEALAAVLAVLDEVGAHQAVLMGKSWGGGIAIQAALQHPERVRQLILTAPAYREPGRLVELKQATLLAWAEDDPVIPFRFAALYAEAAPNVELVVYPTGGHSAGPKNAEDFSQHAIRFLQSGRAL